MKNIKTLTTAGTLLFYILFFILLLKSGSASCQSIDYQEGQYIDIEIPGIDDTFYVYSEHGGYTLESDLSYYHILDRVETAEECFKAVKQLKNLSLSTDALSNFIGFNMDNYVITEDGVMKIVTSFYWEVLEVGVKVD